MAGNGIDQIQARDPNDISQPLNVDAQRAPQVNPELGNVSKPSGWAIAGRVFLGIVTVFFSELIIAIVSAVKARSVDKPKLNAQDTQNAQLENAFDINRLMSVIDDKKVEEGQPSDLNLQSADSESIEDKQSINLNLQEDEGEKVKNEQPSGLNLQMIDGEGSKDKLPLNLTPQEKAAIEQKLQERFESLKNEVNEDDSISDLNDKSNQVKFRLDSFASTMKEYLLSVDSLAANLSGNVLSPELKAAMRMDVIKNADSIGHLDPALYNLIFTSDFSKFNFAINLSGPTIAANPNMSTEPQDIANMLKPLLTIVCNQMNAFVKGGENLTGQDMRDYARVFAFSALKQFPSLFQTIKNTPSETLDDVSDFLAEDKGIESFNENEKKLFIDGMIQAFVALQDNSPEVKRGYLDTSLETIGGELGEVNPQEKAALEQKLQESFKTLRKTITAKEVPPGSSKAQIVEMRLRSLVSNLKRVFSDINSLPETSPDLQAAMRLDAIKNADSVERLHGFDLEYKNFFEANLSEATQFKRNQNSLSPLFNEICGLINGVKNYIYVYRNRSASDQDMRDFAKIFAFRAVSQSNVLLQMIKNTEPETLNDVSASLAKDKRIGLFKEEEKKQFADGMIQAFLAVKDPALRNPPEVKDSALHNPPEVKGGDEQPVDISLEEIYNKDIKASPQEKAAIEQKLQESSKTLKETITEKEVSAGSSKNEAVNSRLRAFVAVVDEFFQNIEALGAPDELKAAMRMDAIEIADSTSRFEAKNYGTVFNVDLSEAKSPEQNAKPQDIANMLQQLFNVAYDWLQKYVQDEEEGTDLIKAGNRMGTLFAFNALRQFPDLLETIKKLPTDTLKGVPEVFAKVDNDELSRDTKKRITEERRSIADGLIQVFLAVRNSEVSELSQ